MNEYLDFLNKFISFYLIIIISYIVIKSLKFIQQIFIKSLLCTQHSARHCNTKMTTLSILSTEAGKETDNHNTTCSIDQRNPKCYENTGKN